MSSFVRTIERTAKRALDPTCSAAHYKGRGSRLGVTNTSEPRRKTGAKAKSTPAKELLRLNPPVRAQTPQDRRNAHKAKMEFKRTRTPAEHAREVRRRNGRA